MLQNSLHLKDTALVDSGEFVTRQQQQVCVTTTAREKPKHDGRQVKRQPSRWVKDSLSVATVVVQ